MSLNDSRWINGREICDDLLTNTAGKRGGGSAGKLKGVMTEIEQRIENAPAMRVSDADRSGTLRRLHNAVALGLIDIGEFEERSVQVSAARRPGLS